MDTMIPKNITHCIRCGTCCLKGGPVLHHEDKKILLSGNAGHQHLITIRKGELAHNPVSGRLEPVKKELIKLRGKGEGWSCVFYDEEKASCKIYKHRFLECRLLQCWDTSKVMSVIGKNTIVRADIMNPHDPVMKLIETHENECSCQEVQSLISAASFRNDTDAFKKLIELVRKDLAIRSYAMSESGLKSEYELFIFGRPLYKIINDHGLSVRFSDTTVHNHSEKPVKWESSRKGKPGI
jgi:Fe-S-cluster containining protein